MEPKDWIALLVGIPTLGFSAFNVWITLRNRSSIHRDFLYKKQVEEYEKFFKLTCQYNRRYFKNATSQSFQDSNDFFYFDAWQEYSDAEEIINLYGAESVADSVSKFSDALWEIMYKCMDIEAVDQKFIDEKMKTITLTRSEILRSMRVSLGFDELSDEIIDATRARKALLAQNVSSQSL